MESDPLDSRGNFMIMRRIQGVCPFSDSFGALRQRFAA
jgi:hypothetical protein